MYRTKGFGLMKVLYSPRSIFFQFKPLLLMDIQTPETLKMSVKGYENLVQMYETCWRSLSRPYTWLSVIPSFIYICTYHTCRFVIHTNCQFLCFLKIEQLNSLIRPFYILWPFKSLKKVCPNFVEIYVNNIRQEKAYKVYIFFF